MKGRYVGVLPAGVFAASMVPAAARFEWPSGTFMVRVPCRGPGPAPAAPIAGREIGRWAQTARVSGARLA
jgi:hypothetical protein